MPERRCGDCTMCCKLLPVRELKKPANTRCQHQSRKGCAIYHQLGFPPSCALWNCAWLGGEDLPRPDRCGWVVDVVPDLIRARNNETGEVQEIIAAQIWVDGDRDLTFDPRLRRYAERCAEKNVVLLLRYGSRQGMAVFAPSLAIDGKWHFVRHNLVVESESGNLLIDRLRAEREARHEEPLLPAEAGTSPRRRADRGAVREADGGDCERARQGL